MNIRKTPIVEPKNKEKMFKVIKCAFTQRRKTLLNSLVNTNILDSKQQGINMLNSLNINENIRPEELTIEQFKKNFRFFVIEYSKKKKVYDIIELNIYVRRLE